MKKLVNYFIKVLLYSVALLLLGHFLFSCASKDAKEFESIKTFNYKIEGYAVDIDVFIIDSCEYIVYRHNSTTSWGSHKGNCKNPIHSKHIIRSTL